MSNDIEDMIDQYDDREMLEARQSEGVPGKEGDRHLLDLMYALHHSRKRCAHEDEEHQVVEAQRGNTACFEELSARYWQRLWRLCYELLGSREEAADTALNVLVKAWMELSSLKYPLRFGPWLFGIARRECFNSLAKQARRRDLASGEPIPLDAPEPDDTPILLERLAEEDSGQEYAEAQFQADRNTWSRCWMALPQKDRELLLYVYRWGATLREAGWSMGAATIQPEDDAKTKQAKQSSAHNLGKYHVKMALKRLEEILGQQGFVLIASEALRYLQEEEDTTK